MAANVAQNPYSALDIGAGCVGDLGVAHKYGNAPDWSQKELATLYVMHSMHFLALKVEKSHACCGYLLFQAALESASDESTLPNLLQLLTHWRSVGGE
jgi:hypothetical protein